MDHVTYLMKRNSTRKIKVLVHHSKIYVALMGNSQYQNTERKCACNDCATGIYKKNKQTKCLSCFASAVKS